MSRPPQKLSFFSVPKLKAALISSITLLIVWIVTDGINLIALMNVLMQKSCRYLSSLLTKIKSCYIFFRTEYILHGKYGSTKNSPVVNSFIISSSILLLVSFISFIHSSLLIYLTFIINDCESENYGGSSSTSITTV